MEACTWPGNYSFSESSRNYPNDGYRAYGRFEMYVSKYVMEFHNTLFIVGENEHVKEILLPVI